LVSTEQEAGEKLEVQQMGRIQDSHDELYHYTTAAGLSGILQSKSLWATHTSFVNDAEEILGFYDRVLPLILRPVFRKTVEDQPEFQKKRGNTPLELYCETQFAKRMHGFRRAASLWHDHYVTSFSATSDPWIREHGLLSQWRAYGPDGGYALVFDTGQLDKLVSEETTPYQDEIYSWADVQYGLNDNHRTDDSDTNNWIERLETAADKFFRSNSTDDAGALSAPLTILSSFFKHRGFSEEREVRLVLGLLGPGLESHPELQSVRQHPVKTTVREGATVPFVELCVQEVSGVRQHLPIKRIIIGPHRDKDDRKRAVKLLLKQYDLNADVSVSEIPYRGR